MSSPDDSTTTQSAVVDATMDRHEDSTPLTASQVCAGPDILPHILRHLDKSSLAKAMCVQRSFFEAAGPILYDKVTLDFDKSKTWPVWHLLSRKKSDPPPPSAVSKVRFLRRTRALTLVITVEDIVAAPSPAVCAGLCDKVFESVTSLTIISRAAPLHFNLTGLFTPNTNGKSILDIMGVRVGGLQSVALSTLSSSVTRRRESNSSRSRGYRSRQYENLWILMPHLTALRVSIDIGGGHDSYLLSDLELMFQFAARSGAPFASAPFYLDFVNGFPHQYIATHLVHDLVRVFVSYGGRMHLTDSKPSHHRSLAALEGIFRIHAENEISRAQSSREIGWGAAIKDNLAHSTFTSRIN